MKKDTKKATAAKSEAVKEKDTTVKTAASKEPAKIASKKKEPAKIASKKKEPAKISSKKKEPAKIASKKKEPAKIASKKKEPAKIASKKKEPRRKLLLVTPEAQPFLNSGGLGEVAGSLPVALADKGHLDVRVVLPKYRDIPEEYKKEMKFVKWFNVPVGWRSQYCGIFTYERKGVTFYFIDNEYYFDRDGLYGYYDDGERFAFFSRAVMEMMGQLDYYPEIVHANDWQTALVPIYNTSIYHYGFKSVFTIHNIAYQGQYDLAIRGDLFGLPPEAGAFVEYDGCINLMKGAIECSNIVTTVSPTYAAELKNPYYAEGLEDIIKRNDFKMRGILNGISFQAYNPEDDENLAATYSVKDLSGKAEDKQRLQELCNLPVNPDVPVLAIISRLVYHKGIQLLQIAADSIVNDDVQLVILGVGDKAYENYFQWLASQYPAKVSANITFSGAMSHRIYAGADILLMPSLTEPCGLAQMIACRYGTVPIVRETGGLRDSVKDCSTGEGNGFTFAGTDPAELSDAVKRAVELYRSKDEWKALVEHIMGLDFSWDKSSGDYEDVYRELVDF